jgi:hypothetical protein
MKLKRFLYSSFFNEEQRMFARGKNMRNLGKGNKKLNKKLTREAIEKTIDHSSPVNKDVVDFFYGGSKKKMKISPEDAARFSKARGKFNKLNGREAYAYARSGSGKDGKLTDKGVREFLDPLYSKGSKEERLSRLSEKSRSRIKENRLKKSSTQQPQTPPSVKPENPIVNNTSTTSSSFTPSPVNNKTTTVNKSLNPTKWSKKAKIGAAAALGIGAIGVGGHLLSKKRKKKSDE